MESLFKRLFRYRPRKGCEPKEDRRPRCRSPSRSGDLEGLDQPVELAGAAPQLDRVPPDQGRSGRAVRRVLALARVRGRGLAESFSAMLDCSGLREAYAGI